MNDLISTAILVATLFGGTVVADKIYILARNTALAKAAEGLPNLSPFAEKLSRKKVSKKN